MQRTLALGAILLVFGACDPLRRLTVSGPIVRSLDRSCVVEALRMEKTVKQTALASPGVVYAEVILPAHIAGRNGYPTTTGIYIEEQRNDRGELQINVFKNWVGSNGSREYRDYMLRAMGEFRDRTIERCGGK